MSDQELLQRVPRRGLCIGGEMVPLAFFRHGQPGRRFVVCLEERGWRIHVRAIDKEAIRNDYRQYAAARPSRPSRRGPDRAGKQAGVAGPPSGIPDPSNPTATGPVAPPAPPPKDPDKLKDEERRELERANALAVQLVEMKTGLMDRGRVALADQVLRRLQKRHALHLDRCLRLRSLLSDFAGGSDEDLQPA